MHQRKEELEARQIYRDQLLQTFAETTELQRQELQARGEAKAQFCAFLSTKKQELFKARKEAYLAQVRGG